MLAPQRGRIATEKVKSIHCENPIQTGGSCRKRNTLPELSNFCCLPGKAGGSPHGLATRRFSQSIRYLSVVMLRLVAHLAIGVGFSPVSMMACDGYVVENNNDPQSPKPLVGNSTLPKALMLSH